MEAGEAGEAGMDLDRVHPEVAAEDQHGVDQGVGGQGADRDLAVALRPVDDAEDVRRQCVAAVEIDEVLGEIVDQRAAGMDRRDLHQGANRQHGPVRCAQLMENLARQREVMQDATVGVARPVATEDLAEEQSRDQEEFGHAEGRGPADHIMEVAGRTGFVADPISRVHHHHEDDGNPLGNVDPIETL